MPNGTNDNKNYIVTLTVIVVKLNSRSAMVNGHKNVKSKLNHSIFHNRYTIFNGLVIIQY